MTSLPWEADRELDIESARQAIQVDFPSLGLESVEYLGAGWDYDAYLYDRIWVVRFPRRAEVARRLDREEIILDLFRPALEPGVLVPKIEIRAKPNRHFPHRFFGHRCVPGFGADALAAPPDPRLSTDIGKALAVIHSIPLESGRASGLPSEKEGCLDRYRETRRLTEDGASKSLTPEVLTWLRSDATVPQEFPGPPCAIHNDLGPEHIIVSEGSGRLVGIIDWSDAALGDPALDFIVFPMWRGWAFTESVLGAYGRSFDRGFEGRLRFLTRVLAIKWLADAEREGGDVEKHLAWVRNAFG